jgi:hypothetical protein
MDKINPSQALQKMSFDWSIGITVLLVNKMFLFGVVLRGILYILRTVVGC